ncbi:phage tail tube protein [Paludibacterium denitrificans]|uniref:Uncharacterized protein n=1 Tax=Paludibacterium denitrificans TaxID=2675226 RepID=A0A844GGL2_9NEIS|nr:phage tail tube protein [Paludibacterium denitrificans]MTD34027.1 hypothetical protein [Paludibacterium denitrificans]
MTRRIESLKPNFARSNMKSSEITQTRQILSMRLGTHSASYQYAAPLILGNLDAEIQAAFSSARQSPTSTGSFAAVAASQTITRSTGSWLTDGFLVGDMVKLSGFTVTDNNSMVAMVTALTATTMTVDVLKPTDATTLLDDAAAAYRTVALAGKRVSVGNAALTTFGIEHYLPDNSVYELFSGMAVNKLQIDAKPGDMVKATIDFVGLTSTIGSAPQAGATYTSAPTNDPMDAFSGKLYVGGVASGNITTLQVSLDNGRKTADGVVGSPVAPGLIEGTNDTQVSLTAYFSDNSLANAFRNEQSIAIDVPFFDPNGTDFIKLRMGNVKITSVDEGIQMNGYVLLTIKGQALLDSASGTNCILQRSNTP